MPLTVYGTSSLPPLASFFQLFCVSVCVLQLFLCTSVLLLLCLSNPPPFVPLCCPLCLLCIPVVCACVRPCVCVCLCVVPAQLTIEKDKLKEAQRLIRESEAKVGVLSACSALDIISHLIT